MVPEWYDDDRPTQRDALVTAAVPAVSSSPGRPLLTVLVGLNEGQVVALDRAETFIGRGRDAHVGVDDAGISRRHARIVRLVGPRYVIEDLHSANGVFVNGRKIEHVELVDGDRIQVGARLVLRFGFLSADEEALAHKLYEGSTRDALTGLYNRRYAGERLVAEVAHAQRHGTLFGLVLFDIDHFKRVNDAFGHQAGDGVLRVVAAQVQKAIRTEDVLARYGGEEFVVLVRGVEHDKVAMLAERIRRGVERLSMPCESKTIRTSVSIGVASLTECGPKATAEALMKLADERLYRAKTGGRNRVCRAGEGWATRDEHSKEG